MYNMICVYRIQIVYTSIVYIELIVYIIPTLIVYIYSYTVHLHTLYILSIQKLNHYSNLGKTFLAIDSASILTGNTTTANTTATGVGGGSGSGIRKSLSSRESAMNNMRNSYFYNTTAYTNNYDNNTSPRGVDDLTLTGGSFQ